MWWVFRKAIFKSWEDLKEVEESMGNGKQFCGLFKYGKSLIVKWDRVVNWCVSAWAILLD